jgi:predicted Rossmann fold nucleotide-binding protein DprA/Smf involved in DNA uptake
MPLSRIIEQRKVKMNENSAKSQNHKQKKPIQILRDRRGGVPKELAERNREQTKLRKQLSEALKDDGVKTVPELAQATGIPSHEVFWHLMSLKKYGKIVEGEQRDGYYEYVLKRDEE